MTFNKSAVYVRAQEIVAKGDGTMLLQDALVLALREMFSDNPDGAIGELARLLSANGSLRKLTYEMPENNGQGQLFDVPGWLIINSPEGELAIPRNQATLGDVRQWRREGLQHHAVQHMRFKRAGTDLQAVQDLDDDMPWSEARALIAQRQAELPEVT